MSYHNNPLFVPWQMPYWNDIMHRFLHQYVTMVDIFFIQQQQYNEVEMEMDTGSHPESNGEVQPIYEKEKVMEKKEKESCKNTNPERHTYDGGWINKGRFFAKIKQNMKIQNAAIRENRYHVLDNLEELDQMEQLQEENQANASSQIKIH